MKLIVRTSNGEIVEKEITENIQIEPSLGEQYFFVGVEDYTFSLTDNDSSLDIHFLDNNGERINVILHDMVELIQKNNPMDSFSIETTFGVSTNAEGDQAIQDTLENKELESGEIVDTLKEILSMDGSTLAGGAVIDDFQGLLDALDATATGEINNTAYNSFFDTSQSQETTVAQKKGSERPDDKEERDSSIDRAEGTTFVNTIEDTEVIEVEPELTVENESVESESKIIEETKIVESEPEVIEQESKTVTELEPQQVNQEVEPEVVDTQADEIIASINVGEGTVQQVEKEIVDTQANEEVGIYQNDEGTYVQIQNIAVDTPMKEETVQATYKTEIEEFENTREIEETFTNTRTEIQQQEVEVEVEREVVDTQANEEAGIFEVDGNYYEKQTQEVDTGVIDTQALQDLGYTIDNEGNIFEIDEDAPKQLIEQEFEREVTKVVEVEPIMKEVIETSTIETIGEAYIDNGSTIESNNSMSFDFKEPTSNIELEFNNFNSGNVQISFYNNEGGQIGDLVDTSSKNGPEDYVVPEGAVGITVFNNSDNNDFEIETISYRGETKTETIETTGLVVDTEAMEAAGYSWCDTQSIKLVQTEDITQIGNVGNNQVDGFNPEDTEVSQVFDFGSELANQMVTITIDLEVKGSWDNNERSTNDYFSIKSNGQEVDVHHYSNRSSGHETDDVEVIKSSGTDQEYQYDVYLDENGQVQLEFMVASTATGEVVNIENIEVAYEGITGWTQEVTETETVTESVLVDAPATQVDPSEIENLPTIIETKEVEVEVEPIMTTTTITQTQFQDIEVEVPFEDTRIIEETFTDTREIQVIDEPEHTIMVVDQEVVEQRGYIEINGEYFQAKEVEVEPIMTTVTEVVAVEYPIDFMAALVDGDGSEVLEVELVNIPQDGVLSEGVRNEDGSWTISVPEGETSLALENIVLTVPNNSESFELGLQATSTETETGDVKEVTVTDFVQVVDADTQMLTDDSVEEITIAEELDIDQAIALKTVEPVQEQQEQEEEEIEGAEELNLDQAIALETIEEPIEQELDMEIVVVSDEDHIDMTVVDQDGEEIDLTTKDTNVNITSDQNNNEEESQTNSEVVQSNNMSHTSFINEVDNGDLF